MYTVNIAMHDDYYRIIIILGILGVTQVGGGKSHGAPTVQYTSKRMQQTCHGGID